ncbi:LPXTG cell wall anchor domain-containing protein, partial [Methylobacterium sp. WL19]|uniref:LPXTG cell wall anchor domain-containing protein n=1 Tax=Methylobacterium sp. WL19 TaxID=2603896 RepID=UPI001FED7B36
AEPVLHLPVRPRGQCRLHRGAPAALPVERRAALIPAQATVPAPAQAVPLPQTGAGTRAQILLGLVLLLGGLLTLRRVRSVRCAA